MIVTHANTSAAMTTASDTELRVLLDTTEGGQGRMSLAMEILRPGQHTEPHWHTHLEEIYYILTGQGRMEIGDEAQEVHAGDAILIPINLVHCLHNTGEDDLALLCAVSPPWYPKDHHLVREDRQ
jgi:mannose-6-phosphate isomerase-like protein (cupin superfamily)